MTTSMACEGVPALLEALFIYGKAEGLDAATKAALRLCNKHFKNLVDATVVEAKKCSDDLNADLNTLLNIEWQYLNALHIQKGSGCPNRLTELPSGFFVKFSRLETLKIYSCKSLKKLPEEIGELSHLKLLQLHGAYSLSALPSSLGKLTTLEKIILRGCNNLTVEGLAPLQHLTGLTSLALDSSRNSKLMKYPDFLCNLTSLKELVLDSDSIRIKTLPDALGNLTNLKSLVIGLDELKELPESIGNLNALKVLEVKYSNKFTTLPESLDDLLWRKAHETEESNKMEWVDFRGSYSLVPSPKLKQALELLEQNGADITNPWHIY